MTAHHNDSALRAQMETRLYECRDAVKRMFGDDYKARIDGHIQIIKSLVKTTDMNELQAALHAAKETRGITAVFFMAAFVEITGSTNIHALLPEAKESKLNE